MSTLIYGSFDEIPSATELKRMWRLQDAALRKCADAPELLSDAELQVLAVMGSEDEARKARRARSKALLEAERRATKAAAPVTAPATRYAKAATWPPESEITAEAFLHALLKDLSEGSPSEPTDDHPVVARFFKRNQTAAVPMSLFVFLWRFVKAVNFNNKQRNAKDDALEKRIAELEARR